MDVVFGIYLCMPLMRRSQFKEMDADSAFLSPVMQV